MSFMTIITPQSWSVFDPKFSVSRVQSGPPDEAFCKQVALQVADEYRLSVLRPDDERLRFLSACLIAELGGMPAVVDTRGGSLAVGISTFGSIRKAEDHLRCVLT
jgi:hypothetical protein